MRITRVATGYINGVMRFGDGFHLPNDMVSPINLKNMKKMKTTLTKTKNIVLLQSQNF